VSAQTDKADGNDQTTQFIHESTSLESGPGRGRSALLEHRTSIQRGLETRVVTGGVDEGALTDFHQSYRV
jgi:hypothetical protein